MSLSLLSNLQTIKLPNGQHHKLKAVMICFVSKLCCNFDLKKIRLRFLKAPSEHNICSLDSHYDEHETYGDRPHAVHERPGCSNELV